MNCKKCRGRVFVDRLLSEKSHVELSCLLCGKRWMIPKDKNPLARFVAARERYREDAIVVM
jgi:hypothetical protein